MEHILCLRVWRRTTSNLGLVCRKRIPAPGKTQGLRIWWGNCMRHLGSEQRCYRDLESGIIHEECTDVVWEVCRSGEGGCLCRSTGEVTPCVCTTNMFPTSLVMGHGHREPLHPWVLDGRHHKVWENPLFHGQEEFPESQTLPGLAAFYYRCHTLFRMNTKLYSSL